MSESEKSPLSESAIILEEEKQSSEEDGKGSILDVLSYYWKNPLFFFKLCLISLPSASQGWMWDKNQYVVSYFLGLGMSNNVASINDIVGAVAGLTVGIIFGAASDTCTSRWGRRRPFLFIGLITSVICHQIISYAPEIGRLLGDPEPTSTSPNSSIAIAIMLPFFFLSDFTQNIMQLPQIAIVADFAGDHQASAQMIRIIIASLFGRLFSTFAAYFRPTTSIQNMHIFFFVVDGASILLHIVCYIAANEKVLENKNKKNKKFCFSIGSVFDETVSGLRELPKSILSFGICFTFAAFAVAANLKYLAVTGELTFGGDPNGAVTCGTNCTPQQLDFIRGTDFGSQVLAIAGWICFGLNFAFFVLIEPLLIHWGIGKCFAVMELFSGVILFIPLFHNTWVSATLEFFALFAQQMVWQLPWMAVAMYCHVHKIDKVSLYSSALNAMGCLGNISAGIMNTSISSINELGFGLAFIVSGGCALLAIVLSLGTPNFVVKGSEIDKIWTWREFSCRGASYKKV